jgi:hypothetical protein
MRLEGSECIFGDRIEKNKTGILQQRGINHKLECYYDALMCTVRILKTSGLRPELE